MSLQGICRQIEADFMRSSTPIREGLGDCGKPPPFTGLGVVLDHEGREFIEIRVLPGTDSVGLARALARRYRLPIKVLHVVEAPAAHAHYALQAGDAVGHASCQCLGTIGAFFLNQEGGRNFILSNAHVLALDGEARRGDWIVDRHGIAIGRLVRSTRFSPGYPHEIDAAVAELVDGVRPVVAGYLLLNPPRRGGLVTKVGARTGETVGRIVSTNYSLAVEMAIGTIWFWHQIVIAPLSAIRFSGPGDSGALIRDYGSPESACGLLFAGDDERSALPPRSYANHLAAVIRGLDIPVR